jgi:hypothetical protein
MSSSFDVTTPLKLQFSQSIAFRWVEGKVEVPEKNVRVSSIEELTQMGLVRNDRKAGLVLTDLAKQKLENRTLTL